MKSNTIRVTICYSERGNYGPVQHTLTARTYTINGIRQLAQNADVIDWTGVSGAAYDADLRVIFQVSGYTGRRGAFCDLPDIRPYYDAAQPYPYHTPEELRHFLDSVPTWTDEVMAQIT